MIEDVGCVCVVMNEYFINWVVFIVIYLCCYYLLDWLICCLIYLDEGGDWCVVYMTDVLVWYFMLVGWLPGMFVLRCLLSYDVYLIIIMFGCYLSLFYGFGIMNAA